MFNQKLKDCLVTVFIVIFCSWVVWKIGSQLLVGVEGLKPWWGSGRGRWWLSTERRGGGSNKGRGGGDGKGWQRGGQPRPW